MWLRSRLCLDAGGAEHWVLQPYRCLGLLLLLLLLLLLICSLLIWSSL